MHKNKIWKTCLNVSNYAELILQEKELQLPIHRSRSVPAFTEEDTPVGGMFRIVRNIPQLNEKIATITCAASPTSENGKFIDYSLKS
jgi:hypothetical protein